MAWSQHIYLHEISWREMFGYVPARRLAEWCSEAEVEDSDQLSDAINSLVELFGEAFVMSDALPFIKATDHDAWRAVMAHPIYR